MADKAIKLSDIKELKKLVMDAVNDAVGQAKADVENDIIDGAPEAYNTLREVAAYISTHKDEYDALFALVGDKVSKSDLQAAIGRIDALETNVNTLNGEETATGSVRNIAKNYADAAQTAAENTAKSYADAAQTAAENTANAGIKALKDGAVKDNSEAINELKGKVEALENKADEIRTLLEPDWYYDTGDGNAALWTDAKSMPYGNTQTYSITVESGAEIQYTSLNPDIMEVTEADGKIVFKAVGIGDATVHLYAPAKNGYFASERVVKFNVESVYEFSRSSYDNVLTWKIYMRYGYIDLSDKDNPVMYYYEDDADGKAGQIFYYDVSYKGNSYNDRLISLQDMPAGVNTLTNIMGNETIIAKGQETLTLYAKGNDNYLYQSVISTWKNRTTDFTLEFSLVPITDAPTRDATITAYDLTASVGDVKNINATVNNGEGSNIDGGATYPSPLTYESLTPEIVEVTSEGDVFCLKPGLGKIVLKTPEWRTYAPAQKTVYILVDKMEPKWYYSENSSNWGLLWEDVKELTLGDEVTYEIWNDRDAPAEYTSLNPSVVEIVSVNSETNEITFKAVGVGDAGVYIYAPETESSTPSERNIKFKVNKPSPTITARNKTMTWGDDSINLGATVDSGANLSYFSSNEDVAYVDRFGNVTARNAGWTNITIIAEETTEFDAGEKTVRVTVDKKPPETTVNNLDLMLGEVEALNVVSESDGSREFRSSNTSVAKVNALGNVEAVGVGTAEISVTVRAYGNYSAKTVKAAVTVGEFVPGTETPTITASDIELTVNDVVLLGTALGVSVNSGGELTYESSDPSIVEVTEDGTAFACRAGQATITITSAPTRKYASGTKTVTITVIETDTRITASDRDIELGVPTDLEVYPSSGGDITCTSLAPDVVGVDVVNWHVIATGLKLGYADIVINVTAIPGFTNAASKTIRVTVVEATS